MEQNAGLLLTKRAHLNPALEAWVDVATERRFTYVQMNSRCNRTAHFLKDLGVKKGDRVALLMMNSIEFMESFFAIAKLGAVCVPLTGGWCRTSWIHPQGCRRHGSSVWG